MNNSTAAHKDITPEFTYPQPKNEITIGDIGDKSLILNFDGGDISSDAGALLIREIEERIGLIKSMAGVIPDCRDARYVRHTLTDLLMQRVAQIASGYEDANDCDGLRNDPVFKILAGRHPEIGDALSSQPTVSCFENSVSRTTLYRLAVVFVDASVASYSTPPTVIVPDFDDTEDRGHGNRQLN
ncbi:transposase [Desulfococcaceae bacterium HSG9]|nr:transposase [Desulfococcaceae bacterium HSG9]